MSEPIRILLADDHNLLRQGIAQMLSLQPDMTVVAQAQNGVEALELVAEHKPDVVLMDINMPEMDGVAATKEITTRFPETQVLILTMYRRDDYVFDAIKAGANGYLLKEVGLDELLASVRAVARGEAVISPAIAGRVLLELRTPSQKDAPKPEPIPERDAEILQLLAQGMSNQDIADRLFLSEKTIRNRLSLIFKRLHLKNRTEAALYAIKRGFAPPDEDSTGE